MASRFSSFVSGGRTRISGRKAIVKALRALGPEATKIALKAAEAGIRVFERELRNSAPVLTGKLKMAMRSRARYRPRQGDVIAWAGPTKNGAHAVFSEYGYFSVWANREIAARPWARPAFERTVSGVEATMLAKLASGILAAARARRGRAS